MSAPIKAILFDLSGVLYEGDRLIDGAVDTVTEARRRGLILRFVTNTATRTRAAILDRLRGFSIPLDDDELVTAPDAAKHYLREKKLKASCLVHESIRGEFEEFESDRPDAVVIGDAREGFTYRSLDRAFGLIHGGAPLITIGLNRCFRDETGIRLDAGAFVHGLAWAAEIEPVIMGKPSAEFFHQVVAGTGFRPGECLMVGDDAECDVVAACDAGLQGMLVKTGKYMEGDERMLPPGATLVDSVADCLDAVG